jgi:TPR repeat protein
MVQAPGGYPRVPTEEPLTAVEQLPKDEVAALAKNGRRDAQIQLARLLWWDGDASQPVELLRPHAEAGIPVAQYLLSTYLRFRNRDTAGSLRWLREAARQGHPVAQETIAGYLERGANGIEQSLPEAFAMYLAAGRQGLRNAQMNVGIMLCKGLGVSPDKPLGKLWFQNSQAGQLVPLSPRAAGCDDA